MPTFTPPRLLNVGARRRQFQEAQAAEQQRKRGISREELADPLNLDSELTPSDRREDTHYEPSELDKRAVKLVQDRYKAAWEAKQAVEARYRESLAYVNDDQWVEWDSKHSKYKSLAVDKHRNYPVFNVIRPRTRKLRGRALQSKIEISISPLTGRKKDILATRQGRGLISHFELIHDEADLTARAVHNAVDVGPIASMVYWDKNKVVPMPVFSADPMPEEEIERIVDFAAGEVGEELISLFELFPDPKAKSWDELEWIIHAKERSLEYIVTKYGERGKYVDPGHRSGIVGAVMEMVDRATGRTAGTSNSAKNTETVITLWGKPSKVYPKGLYIVIAGDVLLHPTNIDEIAEGAGNLPYPKWSVALWSR